MTKAEATAKALEWSNLVAEAESEQEAGCHGSADTLREEAARIEEDLRFAGYDADALLKERGRGI